jgi:hypothetical protein
MRFYSIIRLLTAMLVTITFTFSVNAQKEKQPETFLLNSNLLKDNKDKIKKGDAILSRALANLQQRADSALTHGPYSVTYKSKVPPSGDKHDYMSVGPYWWPDSTKADGLPYIRRDGVVNPERHTIKDSDDLKSLARDVKTMALAYYFTGNERYVQRSQFLLNTWFVDKETKMNPNLNFGQSIPGITAGRGIGLIDTKCFADIVDAVQLMKSSQSWKPNDHTALQNWFGEFLNWMLTNPIGKDEADEHNNHGVYYDLQATSLALFTGNPVLAKKILREQTIPRIESQIKEDGSQPFELARTKSWGYVIMNMKGFLGLALLGEQVNVDLWKYETKDGRSIKKAFEWILPYASGNKQWTHEQIEPIHWVEFLPMLMVAEPHYPSPQVSELITQLKKENKDQLLSLTQSPSY